MDIQVTIKISKEALGEAVSVFREFLDHAGEAEQKALPTQDKPAPYGQQIAPHFPEANTGAAAPAPLDPAPNMTPPAQTAAPATAPAPQTPPAQPAAPAAVPTTEHTYTAEELQVAAVTLVDKGMMAQLQEMLHQFGVSSLPELPAEKYGAFATALRGMGAQI